MRVRVVECAVLCAVLQQAGCTRSSDKNGTITNRKRALALFFDRRTRPSLAGPSWTVPSPERHTAELTHRAGIAHRRPRRRIARTSSPAGWRRRAQKAQ